MAAPRGFALLGLGAGLLAAGVGLGVVIAPGSAPPTIIDHIAYPAPASPAPPPAPRVDAPPSAAPAADSPSESLSPDDRESLRAILDRLPSRPVPSGTGVITGRVRKEDGSPLPGVEVTCTPELSRPQRPQTKPGEKAPERDPVDVALETVIWLRWGRAAKRTSTTDAAGEFRFEGLPDSRHYVAATLAGWDIRPKDWKDTNQARPGADITLTAKPSVEVRCEITCADGPLPDNLVIRWAEPQGRGGWGINPDAPVIRLEPGTHELIAVAGEGEEYRSDPQTVVVPAGSAGVTARFLLRGRPGIRGKLIFPPDEEWDQVQVLLQKLGRDEKPTAAGLRASTRDPSQGRRSSPGTYSLPDLAPGRYGVGVARGHQGAVVAIEEVEVADAPVTRDLRVPPADPSEYVVVRVLGPGGEAVTDFTVDTAFRTKSSSNSGGSTTVKRADGSRLVFHHGGGATDDPEGVYSIAVSTRTLGGARVDYRKGERSEWTVRLEEPARVEARVTGAKGTAYEDRLQFLLQAPGEQARNVVSHAGPGTARPDAEGRQVLSGMQPGEYVLVLSLSFGRMTMPLARVPVTVRSGRNEFSVPLPELHAVAVTGAEGQVQVMRQSGEDRIYISVQSSEGKAVIDGIPEGEYDVRSGSKSQKFRVPGTTKVDL